MKIKLWDETYKRMVHTWEAHLCSDIESNTDILNSDWVKDYDGGYISLLYSDSIDRNGVLICQGDIVKFDLDDRTCQIIYLDSMFQITTKYGNYKLGYYNKFTEVIGNIYENPELLGV